MAYKDFVNVQNFSSQDCQDDHCEGTKYNSQIQNKVIQAQRVWNESDIFLSPGKQERQVIYHFIQEFDPGSG